MDLQGQPALVTGAAKRVGRAIALALGGRGARVAVHCHTARAEAEATAAELRRAGAEAIVVQGDLTIAAVPGHLVKEVSEALGGLAVLVNSAAVFEATPWPVSDEGWARHLETNLTAPMRLIRAAAPALAARSGVVINIADACWERPTWRDHAAYCVSKAGLVALTQSLARILAPGVRVNAVAPGAILPPPGTTEAERVEAVRRVPLGRWGAPEDIAQAVIALIENDYITGQVLGVDGGRSVV